MTDTLTKTHDRLERSGLLSKNFGPAEDLNISFEFSPPKTDELEEKLWLAIKRLEPLSPDFVSVTYGAGGSTRERTHSTVKRIVDETKLQAAAHLTCVGAEINDVDQVIRSYWDAGIRHIVALRGDPPAGIGTRYEPHPGGYAGSPELIAGIKKIGDFEVSVGCYPEQHPDAATSQSDIDVLKRKIDAGADRAITQFFFDPEVFLRFLDRVRSEGIDIPIVPGIMPVSAFKGVKRMAESAGASVPPWLVALFDGLEKDAETRKLVASSLAVEQCLRLREAGIDQFHFYTMNKADLTFAICHILGVRAKNQ